FVAGFNEYLRLDEKSSGVFDSIKMNRQVYCLASGPRPRKDDDRSPGAVLLNEPLRPVFRRSGRAVLERGLRLYRFIDNTQFILIGRTSQSGNKEIWGPLRAGGITTTSREGSLLAIEPDALDSWSQSRSYSLARATMMGEFPDMPRENGWIFSPRINGLTFIPSGPSPNGYGFTSLPLIALTPVTGRGGRGNGSRRGGPPGIR